MNDKIKENKTVIHSNDVWIEPTIFADWILKQNLMIVETLNGNVWKETVFGGKKYTSEELYLMFKKKQNI